jgi:hypothetical protein
LLLVVVALLWNVALVLTAHFRTLTTKYRTCGQPDV